MDITSMTAFKIPRLILLAWLCSILGPAAYGGEAQGWAASLGGFDLTDGSTPEAGLEYRLAPFAEIRQGTLLPAIGISATGDGNVWLHGSLRFDWEINERWIVTPQFGTSLYESGDGKNLGGLLEFRSGLELTYRFEHGARLGLVFYHLSNAHIYTENPGSNSLVLTCGLGR